MHTGSVGCTLGRVIEVRLGKGKRENGAVKTKAYMILIPQGALELSCSELRKGWLLYPCTDKLLDVGNFQGGCITWVKWLFLVRSSSREILS